nr:MAG TPA: hypothetical protein [Caudoviricetes sp.]
MLYNSFYLFLSYVCVFNFQCTVLQSRNIILQYYKYCDII